KIYAFANPKFAKQRWSNLLPGIASGMEDGGRRIAVVQLADLLFPRMQLHKGISSRELEAGSVGLGPVLLFHPSVDTLDTEIQAAHNIPDQVGRRVGALVIGAARLEVSVLQLHEPKGRVRSNHRGPVMLITTVGCEEWQRAQRQIRQG